MNYAQIRKYDIANGEGVRSTLFVSGCKFYCEDCFNTEYQSYVYGNKFEDGLDELLLYLKDEHVEGLSILGGDPLWQDKDGIQSLIMLCHETHKLGKTIWLWSGFTWEQIFNFDFDDTTQDRRELIINTDVFIDGQFKKELKDLCLKWRGSSNQRVIDVKKTIKNKKICLYCE